MILEKKRIMRITVVNPVTAYPKILLYRVCKAKKNENSKVNNPRTVTICNGFEVYEVIASKES